MVEKSPTSLDLKSLRAQFKVMRECPLCPGKFGVETIKVVEDAESSQMLHITCLECLSSVIILVSLTDVGVGLVGIVSELSYEDTCRLKRSEPMTEDEMLSFYEMISDNQQGFIKSIHHLMISDR